MNIASNLVCPVSSRRVDSYVSRTTVFLNAVALGAFMVTGWWMLAALVVVDYGIRMTGAVQYSPIGALARVITSRLGLGAKPVDLAPKLFASRLGWMCAVGSLGLFAAGMTTASLAVAGFFVVLMLADSLANACLGCAIYTYAVLPLTQR